MKQITVGLAADPGLPLVLAGKLQDRFADELKRQVDGAVDWEVEVEELSLPLDKDGSVELTANSKTVRDQRGWDYVLYITDLPKYMDGEPLLATVNTGYGSAMVVLPSLGLVRPRRLGQVLLGSLRALYASDMQREQRSLDDTLIRRTFSVDDDIENSDSHHSFETVKGLFGRLAMQAGMVRSNQPFRLVPKLSSATAAAAATGAFGIFYTSIWSMADYLSTPRLLLIGALSVTIMTVWLIASNGLWERPQGARRRERRLTYNTATAATVILAVATMYVVLFVLILASGLVVINVDYMSDQLGHDAALPEYLNLAWLSASMGIIAGAVGSGLADADVVRKATFSNREYLRRQITLAGQGDGSAGEEKASAPQTPDAGGTSEATGASDATRAAEAAEAAEATEAARATEDASPLATRKAAEAADADGEPRADAGDSARGHR